MQNTIKILVDLKKEIYRFDQAQQGDDVILDLTIIENGVHKDLTGETVELLYINANNTVASVTGDKIIVSGNNVKITCPTDCTRSYGIAKFQLKIVSTYQVSTFPIALTIVPSVDQNQQISQNISTILEDLTAKNIECGETLESLKTWISTGNLLNADLESNIGTGTLLNTDLEDNITTVTQLKTVLSNTINTGDTLNTALGDIISVGNTLDATLKADTETANTAATNLQNVIDIADTTTYATQGQVTEINSHLAESVSMYWTPPIQPPARQDIPGYFADAYNWDTTRYVTDLFEPLRVTDTTYITRKSLGLDASNTYDVWRYAFTPNNFKKTIVIGTGIHGGEITPVLAIYRFLYHLVNDWNKHPQLKWIRNNIRIIWIPFQNPYGFKIPRQRKNFNGVDINRNWDYKWDEYVALNKLPTDTDYQGTAPFSEVETQYIRDTLLEFKDATIYLDCHNLGYSLADSVTYNSTNSPNKFIYENVANWFIRDQLEKTIIYNELENPSGYNYALKKLGMVSGNPEFSDTRFGEKVYDSKEITKAVEWFGNIVIQHAREDIFLADEPFVIENNYTTTGAFVNNLNIGSYAPISPFDFNFNIPCDGVLLFDGEITIKGTDISSQNFICPRIGQVGTNYLSTTLNASRFEVYNEGNMRSTLPFHASAYVQKTEGIVGKAGVGLSGYTQTGSCMIYRYRGRITFIPSKNLNKFSIFTATTTNSMIKTI